MSLQSIACSGGGAGVHEDVGSEPALEADGTAEDALVRGPLVNAPAVASISQMPCLGVLVGRRTVLTSASCYKDTPANIPRTVWFPDGSGRTYAVASVVVHPAFRTQGVDTPSHDLAVLILDTAPPIRPYAVGRTAPSVGQSLTLITSGISLAVRRRANIQVQSASGAKFTWAQARDDQLTRYEYGAPVLDRGVLVGLLSHAELSPVATGLRLSAYATWITQVTGGDVVLATR
jgi:hypothetical protein